MSILKTIIAAVLKLSTAQASIPTITPPVPKPIEKKDKELDVRIGDLAAKYEVGGRGVGYISTGMKGKDPGGISYGNYQLETNKGTMNGYLNSEEAGRYGEFLNKFKVNSEVFKNLWQQFAEDDEEEFNYSQFLYLANKPNGYVDAVTYATKLGWNTESFAMQSAIYSTVNQSGGWKKGIFDKARIVQSDDIVVQINKLYDARARYFKILDLNPIVKKNILLNRTDIDSKGRRSTLNTERDDCLKLIGDY